MLQIKSETNQKVDNVIVTNTYNKPLQKITLQSGLCRGNPSTWTISQGSRWWHAKNWNCLKKLDTEMKTCSEMAVTLMFCFGSKPSSWFNSSNIVRWTSLSPAFTIRTKMFTHTQLETDGRLCHYNGCQHILISYKYGTYETSRRCACYLF